MGGAGLGGVGGESRGHGVVEYRQLSGRHVLAEGALHHAGCDEVFEEDGGQAAASSRACGMSRGSRVRGWARSSVRSATVCPS